MKRIVRAFRRAARQQRAAFVPYITAGDPSLERTFELALALERAGADVLELGVPFSDPIADGPTNQLAAERALAARTTLAGVLGAVRELRAVSDMAVVLFTYANPVVRFGVERFAEHAAASGVDGVLFTDVPAEEMGRFRGALKTGRLAPIMLVTPTSTRARMKAAARLGAGFLYLVSRTGVTGARQDLDRELAAYVEAAREASKLPVAVGFGISTPEQVASVAAIADGVVVGSAIVNQIADEGDTDRLATRVEAFAAPLARACRRSER
ncbi:MAG TPA: tryptophan synthase subunit alpha [Candidatus Sulfomarinibacteraceae bacterium]|nr:tryptophan synthase subunit alpha [Candidatus Sulfomarinibacteraceae bacterium]